MASIGRFGTDHAAQRAAFAASGAIRPRWRELSQRYSQDRDCLASFLALELAEVLQEAKPANLVCLANKRHSCGRNLYELWNEHGAALIRESGLAVKELVDRGTSTLLLIYSADALAALVARKSVRVILAKAGYLVPSDFEAVLSELERRTAGEGFPHEIGVFLGYPLKDVVGFMGWAPLSFTCQGPWKIFGNPAESLRLAEVHHRCRCRMSLRLASGCNPCDCLKGMAGPPTACAAHGEAVFLKAS